MNEAWKKVYFYVCFHMKRGMENPDLDFDSYCNGTKWWNGQTHTGKRNTSISIIHNVQLFLIMVCCFGFSPFHVHQYSCTGTWSFNSIYERHDRDANSRSSLAVSVVQEGILSSNTLLIVILARLWYARLGGLYSKVTVHEHFIPFFNTSTAAVILILIPLLFPGLHVF